MRSYVLRLVGVPALVWAALAGTGCDDGEAVPARVTQCRKVCQQLDMCVADTDLMECDERCEGQEFRSDLYYRAKASCVTGKNALSCDEWAHELDARGEDICSGSDCQLASCVTQELKKVDLSSEQTEYCERLSTKLRACDRSLDSRVVKRSCTDRVLELSPPYLERSAACVDMDCEEIEYCLEELADSYGTDLKVFSGSLDLN